jgi:hypothetical protein
MMAPPRLDLAKSRCQKQVVHRSLLAQAVRPAKAGRGARAAICGLLALAQVLAFAHGATVAHRLCAEHGEAIDVGLPDEANASSALDSALASVLPSPGAAIGHVHEHCLCMAYGRERFLVPQHAGAGVPWRTTAHRWLISPRPTPSLSVALFLLAPKGSPPV